MNIYKFTISCILQQFEKLIRSIVYVFDQLLKQRINYIY